ncbi:MAG: SAM-dependent methyltransferase, partial [Desulfovibrio sp.]
QEYFADFAWPYGFHGPKEYQDWLAMAGLTPRRVELIPKPMDHKGVEGLKGWLRTTWLPYLERLPRDLHEPFLDQAATSYLHAHPLLPGDMARVDMVRLEVEAER